MPKIDIEAKYGHLLGTKINKWLLLKFDYSRRTADVICQCECGTIKPVNLNNLINNKTKDCGCGRKQMLRETKTKNLIGQKFGKLTAIELLPESNKFKRRLYRCQCDCGNEIIVPSSSLTTHHTSSCGCLTSYYNLVIKDLLTEKMINFISEYSVKINEVIYRFDFYLPDYNLFIEYDGQQHFKPIQFGYSAMTIQQEYEDIIRRDTIKNDYCKNNHINLLRIPYYEQNNIENIIINHLQRLSDKGSILE